MATTANIPLNSLNVSILTNNMAVTVTTLDSNGITVTLCSMVGNFAGFTKSQFIDAIVACIISTGAGFTATNANPILKITTNLSGYILAGTTINLSFPPYFTLIGSANISTSLIKGLCAVNNPASVNNGFVFAVAYDTDRLIKISSGVIISQTDLGAGFQPNDIEYHPADFFYVASVGLNAVRKLNPNLTLAANIGVSATPAQVRYSSFNNCIYAVCAGGNALSKIDTSNVVTTINLNASAPGIISPVQCRVNSYNGDVWVVSNISNVVKLVNAADVVYGYFTVGEAVNGIEFIPGNNPSEARFLISQTNAGTILVFDTSGTQVDTLYLDPTVLQGFDKPTQLNYISQINSLVICTISTIIYFYDFQNQSVISSFPVVTNQSEAAYEGDTGWVYVGANQSIQTNLYWFGLITDGTSFSGTFLETAINDGNCPFCYEYPLIACYDRYIFDLGLASDTVYNIILTDKFQRKYRQQVTSDSDGVIILNPDLFPEGMFTPENGDLGMQITDANNLPVEIQFGYTLYTCLTLTFEYNNLME